MKTVKSNKEVSTKVIRIETVEGSKDYSKVFLGEKIVNRPIDKAHVKGLDASKNEWGSARYIKLLKTTALGGIKYLCVDGQHFFTMLKDAKLPFDYEVVQFEDKKADTKHNVVKFTSMLNNSGKGWSTLKYAERYFEIGIKEYGIVLDVVKNTNLKCTDIINIMLGGESGENTSIYKNGELRFTNEVDCMELMNALISIQNVIPNKAFTRRAAIKIMRKAGDYKGMAIAITKFEKELVKNGSGFSENQTIFGGQMAEAYKGYFKKSKIAA